MTKKKTKSIHVIPHNDGWAIREEGAHRVKSVHYTQRDAIDAARKIARGEEGEVLIHARNGRIRNRNRYGSGPLPPRVPREVLFPTSISATRARAIRKAVSEVMRESQSSSALERTGRT